VLLLLSTYSERTSVGDAEVGRKGARGDEVAVVAAWDGVGWDGTMSCRLNSGKIVRGSEGICPVFGECGKGRHGVKKSTGTE
jgi:hypothetical protein